MEKIEELAEKLRKEGVEKGQAQAQQIIAEAQQQAEQIVANARKQADAICQQASKQAAELDANTKSELKLYMGQALNALKSEIANVVTNKIAADGAQQLTTDKQFLGKLAVAIATEWVKDGDIVVSSDNAQALKAYFAQEAKQLLDKGVKIEQVNGLATAFTVSPADGSYRVDFGKEELESYFKGFLRPQLIEMLF